MLPYLPQDDYDRTLVDVEHPVAVLSNDRLRATFLLGQGGRLWSLVDLVTGRELLYANDALQPGNLALRNAWFAGGVEWNLGTTGHHPLTCEPLHAARITLPDGTPGLRLWEYERMRELVVQIDAWLPDGAPHLAVHVTITNVTAHDVPVYWWSNIAVPETPATRVLTPADAAFRFDYSRTLRRVAMPVDDGIDRSYPSRSSHAVDYFFDLPASTPRPWITAVDGDGYGLVQTSSRRLRGRKLFVWGTGRGGRHWQEWLSPRGGAYLEIQAGLARTQLEHLPLPAGERWSWLETYGPLQLTAEAAHGDWSSAVAATAEQVRRDDAWFADQSGSRSSSWIDPVTERLQRASGWGALEVRRRTSTGEGWPDLPGTPFDEEDLGAEQQPWLDLLDGRRPAWDGSAPTSYQTSPGWRSLLEYASGPYAALQRGVARWAGGDRLGAVDAWEQSLRDRPSAVGWRNVAVAYAEDDPVRALAAYREARTLDPTMISLVIEHLELLLDGRPPPGGPGRDRRAAGSPAGRPDDHAVRGAGGGGGRRCRSGRPDPAAGTGRPGRARGCGDPGTAVAGLPGARRRVDDRRGRGAAVGVRLLDAARSVGDHHRRVVVGQLVGVGPLEDLVPAIEIIARNRGTLLAAAWIRRQSSSSGGSRKTSSAWAPSVLASSRNRSRSSRPHVPHSMITTLPARSRSRASSHCRRSTRSRSCSSHRLMSRASSQSSGHSRMPVRSAARLRAIVVLPAPGRPQTMINTGSVTDSGPVGSPCRRFWPRPTRDGKAIPGDLRLRPRRQRPRPAR